ncbi:Lactose transport system permease protein LacG [Petrocella atlantisensis]|uniref:Lactose transport system permease protein LacG n=2 Tax=Petrocella atlantisensis TaxID=2173034 RepID=A0A3P7NYM9_9FIRM|nr:Lactose transport system permease protein LacG [Petrocella atlantisensis]
MIMYRLRNLFKYCFLSIAAFISIFPFIWMIIGATNTATDITKGKMTFGGEALSNLSKLFEMVDMKTILLNSSKIALISTFLLLLFASLAGYGFEIYKSKNKERLYTILLLTMMVPFAALMIPLFRMFANMNLLDSHIAVIIPTIATPFMIFFFRQNTKTFPSDLIQAARVDGLNEYQVFFLIYIPTMRSTFAAAGIIAFMTSWNSFLWPLIVLQSDGQKTITLIISSLSSAYFPEYGVIMVAIVIATLPTILIFFLLQRRFVEGMLGSIK